MAKPNEVVASAVKELSDMVKQIKQADEDDLGKVAMSFYDLSERADEVATVLSKADDALTGQEEEETQSDEEETSDGEEDQQDEEENK